jgi:hypothetical protein
MCLPKQGHVALAPAIKLITNQFPLITIYQKNFWGNSYFKEAVANSSPCYDNDELLKIM